MTIAVDAMGCDMGPVAAVEGAVGALSDGRFGGKITKILLVGRQAEINAHLAKTPHDSGRLEVVDADEVIHVDESPTAAIKTKKNSSIVVGLNLVKQGRAAAFVSAGSTGAVLTGATTIIGRIKGIKRPALGVLLPNSNGGHTFLTDAGANVEVKPEFLLQFAQMGSVYMESVLDVKNPRIGLINVGAEREKGTSVAKASHELLEASQLNFLGNVEARDIPYGTVDVAVCDGFVGNIILKYTEGYAKGLFATLKTELISKFLSRFGALLSRGAFKRMRKRYDYTEVGGAPFIGLNGLVVKAHGSSNAKAMKNSIGQCVKFIEGGVVGKIAAMSSEKLDERDEKNGI
ncbi:MAG: phosphate acyltransferase PlsX [Defluviitaleaceae bacterium]|nr:phosphate acyltransferase PlsX [Defluviitaleaceae bacterium]